jgi:2-dehydro-3-deoxyphosphogluconate aldolase/(4S)-4-hydroxy-2-oxoglutarate aldolase
MTAMAAGFKYLKLFPAEQAGGVAMLKALAGPFRELRFCPTGGITPASAPSYLSQPNVLCVGGSWLAPKASLDAGDWKVIIDLAKAASSLAH